MPLSSSIEIPGNGVDLDSLSQSHLAETGMTAVHDASTLLRAILDDSPVSTFGRLSSHIAMNDSEQPRLENASAASLRHSPALAPSPCLNSALSDLVATLLSPSASTSSAAQVALLSDPANLQLRQRLASMPQKLQVIRRLRLLRQKLKIKRAGPVVILVLSAMAAKAKPLLISKTM